MTDLHDSGEPRVPEEQLVDAAHLEPFEPGEGAGPPRVRVALMLARDDELLLERVTAGGAPAWSLPSRELSSGESIAAAGRAIAARAVEGTLTDLRFVRLAYDPGAAPDDAPVLVLGLSAKLAPPEGTSPDAPPAAPRGDGWSFFPQRALPDELAAEAQEGLRALTERRVATDLDGAVIPPAFGLDVRRSVPPPLPGAAREEAELGTVVVPSTRRLVVVTSLVCAGGVAWASGVTWALATTRMVKEDVALAAWLCGVGGAVFFGVHAGLGGQHAAGTRSQVTRTVGALLLCMLATGLLLFVAASFGGNDEARSAFWLWAFGALTLALALRRADGGAVHHTWPHAWRVAAWCAATIFSVTVVFPPLREALYPRPGDAQSGPVAGPSDDDD